MIRTLLLLLVCGNVLAQKGGTLEPMEKYVFSFGYNFSNPTGDYKQKIENPYINNTHHGFDFGLYFNPYLFSSKESRIFVGAEMGANYKRQREFSTYLADGDFYANHNVFYLRPGIVFFPNISFKKFYPEIKFHVGPRWQKSKFVEEFQDEEGSTQTETLLTYSARSISFNAELGLNYRYKDRGGDFKCIRFALGFEKAGAQLMWNRKVLGIDADYVIIDPIIAAKPEMVYGKIGFAIAR
ncbi:MAG: hypothetical protein ACRCVT_02920 [Leadbetterella sp.]